MSDGLFLIVIVFGVLIVLAFQKPKRKSMPFSGLLIFAPAKKGKRRKRK